MHFDLNQNLTLSLINQVINQTLKKNSNLTAASIRHFICISTSTSM